MSNNWEPDTTVKDKQTLIDEAIDRLTGCIAEDAANIHFRLFGLDESGDDEDAQLQEIEKELIQALIRELSKKQ